MAKEKMLFSLDRLRSVRSSKLREFKIEEINPFEGRCFGLVGMFNNKESFDFGRFDTQEEAVIFLIGIHQIIEGSNK